jgi:hypothetical protein
MGIIGQRKRHFAYAEGFVVFEFVQRFEDKGNSR